MNKLQKHYDKLTDIERFRLAVASWERGDEGELRALRDTAPKATYQMMAWPYRGMLTAIQTVAWVTVSDILAKAWLMMLSWGLDWAHDHDEDSDDSDRMSGRDVEGARCVEEAWDGLALFCDELGITVDQAVAQVPGYGDGITLVVDFARIILQREEALMRILAEVHCPETGDDAEVILAERAVNLATQHAESVREYADVLRKIWEHAVEH